MFRLTREQCPTSSLVSKHDIEPIQDGLEFASQSAMVFQRQRDDDSLLFQMLF